MAGTEWLGQVILTGSLKAVCIFLRQGEIQ